VTTTDTPSAPTVAVTASGAPGKPAGVTDVAVSAGALDPELLFATTWNEYETPLIRPVTVALVAVPGTVVLAPPGEAVTT
jgi:hypothetical protein